MACSGVKTLMMMICDALLNHESGVTNLANRARALGASEEEVKEALGVAYLMGGLPAMVAGSNAFRNIQRGRTRRTTGSGCG
jgi:alkylhydroperoxidase/carboxymuconolactone decarboxylase family protein YurZ